MVKSIKKNALLLLLIVITSSSKAQKGKDILKCADTVIVIFNKYEDFKKPFVRDLYKGYYLNDTIYFVKNKKAKKYGVSALDACNGVKLNICRDKTYFKFYDKKELKIAEGNWYIEGFVGAYKEYYKSGRIKESGTYNGDAKEKAWTYYNEEGKAIKEEVYESGKLLSSKNLAEDKKNKP
ncbi:MAG: hypothetical protein HYU69_12370 [Bacteroidetes bacterium]|nr:hypothetical protein [Bacteroidota bacterium]